jgi:LytR cell envelope-related transcriptional attenuator
MAHTRAYRKILEQSRRHWRILALVATATVLLIIAGAILLRPRHADPAPASAAPPRPNERVMVEVLNGTRRQGAARAATRLLRSQGFDVVFLGNADSLSPKTRVLVRRGDSAKAKYVSAALGGGTVGIDIDTLRRVDVSVILGDDFQPKQPLHP